MLCYSSLQSREWESDQRKQFRAILVLICFVLLCEVWGGRHKAHMHVFVHCGPTDRAARKLELAQLRPLSCSSLCAASAHSECLRSPHSRAHRWGASGRTRHQAFNTVQCTHIRTRINSSVFNKESFYFLLSTLMTASLNKTEDIDYWASEIDLFYTHICWTLLLRGGELVPYNTSRAIWHLASLVNWPFVGQVKGNLYVSDTLVRQKYQLHLRTYCSVHTI